MSNSVNGSEPTGRSGAAPETAPLSLNDLFSAAVDSTSPEDFNSPVSADTPEDPADLDHEEEADDVDTNAPELDPEDESEEEETDETDDDIDEDQVDGHAAFLEGDDEEPEPAKSSEEMTFADLGLPEDLLRAVTDMGFQTPTPIQREAIPVLLSGRDVVGVAQTGTGKTAAFGLPLLDAVDARNGAVQALVLAPTRELALQSAEAISDMAHRSRGLDVVAVYGGAPYGPQIGALKAGAQVVVGTPGRIIDLLEKGALTLEEVKFFVLDEADEMLRMGFAEDVETIASDIPGERRTALFSATMPPAIQAVARQHMTNPVHVEVSRQASTVDTVHQTYAVVPFRHKIGAVARVLAVTEAQAAIVFVRTKSTAEDVAIELAGRGIQAAAISGDVPQRERERLVERLRAGTLDVLVATDVAARGLDVDRIGLVVNFDVPREAEAYVHRIGRTGRAGRHGEAVTFLTPKEKGKLRQIERLTGTRLEEITLPSPADVSAHRARRLLERVTARLERGRLEMYSELVAAKAEELEVEVTDIAATLLALSVGDEGPRTREERKGEPRQRVRREENVDSEGTFVSASFEGGRERRERPEGKPGAARGGRRHEDGFGTTYRLEVGHRDRVLPGAIVGAIANEAGISGSDIGRIDILQSFSLVEVHTPLSQEQLDRLKHATFGGRELRIRVDQGPGHGGDNDGNAPSDFAGERSGRPRGKGGFGGERGQRGGFRGDRDGGRGFGGRGFGGRGERGGERRWDDRGDRGGFRGNRDGGRSFGGDRGERGGFNNDRGGFRGNRDGGRSFGGDRGERSGFNNDRGGFRGNRDGGRGGKGFGKSGGPRQGRGDRW
ncbi:Cold-shock DEAD box protein A [Actinomyces bovis]|uniref:RNA helicase n=1 Tax=Actinomyces bovis TaxID=1658 RepID=A0ABY1VPM6_9ACTO|nr:DEAD/DEAH box helicase [Actinomyces bovis]SPT54074.1 Cold-shock DEAD box protein A [Actinomyces bovis]VEG53730.1 Cold-shock DEAD box protein A [Actinomyces israelii]